MAENVTTQVRADIDELGIISRIQNETDLVQKVLDAQVLKDCNKYCPLDTSMLQKSAILHTVIGSGMITWKTPYARMQYYSCPNKNKDKNPNATQKWCEVAKANRIKTWEAIIHGEYRKNSK